MSKVIDGKDYLDEKIGKEGSIERENFKEEAYTYYLSEILKNRRKELRISQAELASKVGKKRPYISRVENGEDIKISNFLLIANALGLNIELNPT